MGRRYSSNGALFLTAFIFVATSVLVGTKRFRATKFQLKIRTPHIRDGTQQNKSKGALFFIIGYEGRCFERMNYICRFWYFIRCIVFAKFDTIYLVNDSGAGFKKLLQSVRRDDTLIFAWRNKSHNAIPPHADFLLRERKREKSSPILRSLRIGIFHTANERFRFNFTWYSEFDFVLRNYWIRKLPPHALYIPLGPQYPFECSPNHIYSNTSAHFFSEFLFETSTNNCSCSNLPILQASERKHLWSFSGSLRENRKFLVRAINTTASLKGNGVFKIASGFGGNSHFGDLDPIKNPKTEHLKLILNSAFVFAPCGNVMETHRIYEAIALGAIPVIEHCDRRKSHFFPFRQLLIGNYSKAVQFVEHYIGKPREMDRLQKEVMVWWRGYIDELAENVSLTVKTRIDEAERWSI